MLFLTAEISLKNVSPQLSKSIPFDNCGREFMAENRRILFCNIGYLEYYDSTMDNKPIENGGEYPNKHKTGGEINNFLKLVRKGVK